MWTSEAIRLFLRLARFLPLVAVPLLASWLGTQASLQGWLVQGFDHPADTLISGTAIWTNDDLRPLKAAWLMRMPAAKDVMILGGSRAIEISGEWFQPRSFFNAAVHGGGIDEMISFFQLCLEAGKTPKEVVLELNPNLSHEDIPRDPRLLSPYFNHALARYRVPPAHHAPVLSSLHDFRATLQPFRAPSWGLWTGPIPRTSQVLPDGTAMYTYDKPRPTPEELDTAVISSIHHLRRDDLRWRTTSDPAEFDLKLFRCFLDDLQSHGVRVVVLLAPLHPIAYDFYWKLGGYNEAWIRREMAARNITVVGSYSPTITQATSGDFYDDVHSHPAVLRRLLSEAGIIHP